MNETVLSLVLVALSGAAVLRTTLPRPVKPPPAPRPPRRPPRPLAPPPPPPRRAPSPHRVFETGPIRLIQMETVEEVRRFRPLRSAALLGVIVAIVGAGIGVGILAAVRALLGLLRRAAGA